MFKKYDADDSGEIEVYELWRALADYGVHVSEEVAGRMLASFDPDGSGCLDLAEFRAMLAKIESGEAVADYDVRDRCSRRRRRRLPTATSHPIRQPHSQVAYKQHAAAKQLAPAATPAAADSGVPRPRQCNAAATRLRDDCQPGTVTALLLPPPPPPLAASLWCGCCGVCLCHGG